MINSVYICLVFAFWGDIFKVNFKLFKSFIIVQFKMSLGKESASEEISRVGVKAPPFWRTQPALWFKQIESQFSLSGIKNEETKYHHLVSKLECEELALVQDILDPADNDAYCKIKARLLSQYESDQNSRLKMLLKHMELGDKKPSRLLCEMRNLAGTGLSEEILKTLWLQNLPTGMQQILSVSSDSLNKLAEIADAIAGTFQTHFEVNQIASTSQNEIRYQNPFDEINARITRLEQKLDKVVECRTKPTVVTNPIVKNKKLCFYHAKFGGKAHKCIPPCNYKKKLVESSLQAHSDECISRLVICDKSSGFRFLIDTGAAKSVLPVGLVPKKERNRGTLSTLSAANGSRIKTFGVKRLSVNLGLPRVFNWNFVIADVTRPILGADFMGKFGILVDVKNKKLFYRNGIGKSFWVQTEVAQVDADSTNRFSVLFDKFPELINDSVRKPCKHSTKHFIETTGPPVYSVARRLSPQKLKAAKAEFQSLVKNGICRVSKSSYASPLHMVLKKNNEWRICGDYRRLNAITKPDRYPIPNVQDFVNNLEGMTIFSTIDLVKAYNQIPMAKKDIEKTAIITPFGLFEYLFMTFGMRNAGATFQRFIDEVTEGLHFCFAYIDDILVASRNEEEHEEHLRVIFSRLAKYGVLVNKAKSTFGRSEIEFLGHLITKDGIKPLESKVRAISEFPKPETVEELRRFLGLLNYYRKFVSNLAEKQHPLLKFIKGNKKRDKSKLEWTEITDNAFLACKEALVGATLLGFPSETAKLAVVVDASNTSLGGALQQLKGDSWQPISFFSRKLSPAEQNYSAYDRELLAIYASIKYFKYMLEGREFVVFTDHKPLIYMFNHKTDQVSPRRIRHMSFIGQFTTDIRHISGMENVVADTLSRISTIDFPSTVDFVALAQAQSDDAELKQLMEDKKFSFKRCKIPNTNDELICETSTNSVRPFVPESFRKQIFSEVHNMAHPGIRSTVKQIKKGYFWPNMGRDCAGWSRSCIPCQRAKVYRHTAVPVGNFEIPRERFSHVHLDLVGPLPSNKGYRYLLSCVDRYTRWTELYPIRDISAETVANAFIFIWVSRFGVPNKITTDQGRQFESGLFKDLSKLMGSQLCRTTPYHPAANGLVERQHRRYKAALKCKLEDSQHWLNEIPLILLGLRTCLSQDSNVTVAERVYGTSLKLPHCFLEQDTRSSNDDDYVNALRRRCEQIGPVKDNRHGSRACFKPQALDKCSHVFLRVEGIRKSLECPYEGPYKVIARNEKFFELQIQGRHVNISVERLKPAFLSCEDLFLAKPVDPKPEVEDGTVELRRSERIANRCR